MTNSPTLTYINDTMGQLGNDTGNNTGNISLLQSYENDDAQDISYLQNTLEYLNVIAGGPAGHHTLTGIHVGDRLNGVLYLDNASPAQFHDLGTEFSIFGTDTITNSPLDKWRKIKSVCYLSFIR